MKVPIHMYYFLSILKLYHIDTYKSRWASEFYLQLYLKHIWRKKLVYRAHIEAHVDCQWQQLKFKLPFLAIKNSQNSNSGRFSSLENIRNIKKFLQLISFPHKIKYLFILYINTIHISLNQNRNKYLYRLLVILQGLTKQ